MWSLWVAANLYRIFWSFVYIRIVVEDSINIRGSSCDISLTGLTPFVPVPVIFLRTRSITLFLHGALIYDPSLGRVVNLIHRIILFLHGALIYDPSLGRVVNLIHRITLFLHGALIYDPSLGRVVNLIHRITLFLHGAPHFVHHNWETRFNFYAPGLSTGGVLQYNI
jgi:riboflavin transporter FmnP